MKPIRTPGAISWPELQTTDSKKAADFYSAVFGWEMQSMEMSTGMYYVGNLNGLPVGGIMNRMSEHVPVCWGFYLTSLDVDTTIAKATALGATSLMDPWDVPEVGRMGVFEDPQGAVIHVMAYKEPEHEAHQSEFEETFTTPGAFSWFELRVPDAKKAASFYSELLGWEITFQDMPQGPYGSFSVDGVAMGGLLSVDPNEMPPHWASYLTVDNISSFMEKVKANGGTILFDPITIDTVGEFVMVKDPQGGMFSAIKYIPMS